MLIEPFKITFSSFKEELGNEISISEPSLVFISGGSGSGKLSFLNICSREEKTKGRPIFTTPMPAHRLIIKLKKFFHC